MNKHLKFIDSLGCLICGRRATHHHLLRVDRSIIPIDCEYFLIPKRYERGMGKKNDDRFCIPLCQYHHDGLHNNGNEIIYLHHFGYDNADKLALYLWEHSGDYEDCIKKIKGSRWNNG